MTSDYESYQEDSARNLNWLEIPILLFCGILIVVLVFFGFSSQNIVNKDERKEQDMTQLNEALSQFYQASSTETNSRRYPVSTCSILPNEVDFEYTLLQHLTGQEPRLETHAFIRPQNFPFDPFGNYETEKKNYANPKCPAVFKTQNDPKYIYNTQSKACKFDPNSTDNSFKNCYIYSSDPTGISYSLGYFSDSKKQFVIYNKVRGGEIQVQTQ